jgi:SAM-dependent methyltransferase
MTATGNLDFGYPWWLSYGHLAILLPALALLLAGRLRRWPVWTLGLLSLAVVWAGAALFVVRTLNVNGAAGLPTDSFLRSGKGRVVDLGAGTGRSAVMVLTARPQTTLVAVDLFGDSFRDHFGHHGTPQQRLLANLQAAGVAGRASIETADVRQLPFPAGSFDAAVSAFVIDHLGRDGAKRALSEAHRVIKPGGEFLLILVANDAWTKLAFGPLLSHGGVRGPNWWRQQALDAGFQVSEEGTTPGTRYFLLHRPPGK